MNSQEIYDYLKRAPHHIYIWGNGNAADLLDKELKRQGIQVTGHVVDDEYTDGNKCLSRTSVMNRNAPYIILRGFVKSYLLTKQQVMKHWPGCCEEFMFFDLFESTSVVEPITSAYYEANQEKFGYVRQELSDDLSKRTLDAFIRAKISRECTKELSLIEKNQYFGFPIPWYYTDCEVFLDCGAYNGDSIAAFLNSCGGAYRRVIACEPEPNNYRQLMEYIEKKDLLNVSTYCVGVYNKAGTLSFAGGNSSISAIVETGESAIRTETIDNILNGDPVTIIKMDIEGSERYAVAGAKKTIKKQRPILMVCVYHRKDDIFTIYDQLNEYVTDYCYYLRWHMPTASELVLYAIPKERIKN